jgi:hypothetical protein
MLLAVIVGQPALEILAADEADRPVNRPARAGIRLGDARHQMRQVFAAKIGPHPGGAGA